VGFSRQATMVPVAGRGARWLASRSESLPRLRRRVDLLLALAQLACTSALPMPERVDPAEVSGVEVPSPPPAVRPELVPPRPAPEAAWVDGEWRFLQQRWAWVPGAWVVPPPGARLTRQQVRFGLDGKWRVWQASWIDGAGRPLPDPPPAGPAAVTP